MSDYIPGCDIVTNFISMSRGITREKMRVMTTIKKGDTFLVNKKSDAM